ncbi:ParB N-terminal domain-containing protein [Nocardia sp. CDC159]|uniref:ParB N-terminal domain-containing protein n=1 Tax=Nocardia pulmonis TaxID=2951408 RepID=A0A9X2E491_9NOCA|nr:MULTISPECIES: ParB N-terminal domain-containing protein [Nocardia]MCM6773954.1 ParB N-terminal domain-containing protein [Nocardia pulmonis]MCM6786841.1 ParB N-terminal domain-containing protein [Nocardia sp. CDC159]
MADEVCTDSLVPLAGGICSVHDWLSRASSIPVELVPVDSLTIGYSARVRSETNAEHIRTLSEVESPLPPIIVHRSTMRVIDGAHRLQAALALNRDTIAVRYFDGSEEDAFALAVRANVAHGLPLSLAERKSAARRLIESHPQWSDRLIAGMVGLSHKTVGGLRRRSDGEDLQSNDRLGRDGRFRRLDISAARRSAEEYIRTNPGASLREISKSAGISIGTAKDVRDNMTRIVVIPQESEVTSLPEEAARRAGAGASVQQAILKNLRNDPALRLKDNGRQLLRRLALSIMNVHEWEEMTIEVPSHCRGALARLARANAKSWHDLASRLENGAA